MRAGSKWRERRTKLGGKIRQQQVASAALKNGYPSNIASPSPQFEVCPPARLRACSEPMSLRCREFCSSFVLDAAQGKSFANQCGSFRECTSGVPPAD